MIAAFFFALWFAALGAWAGWCARLARFELARILSQDSLPRSVVWRIILSDYMLAPIAMLIFSVILFFAFPWEARCVPYP